MEKSTTYAIIGTAVGGAALAIGLAVYYSSQPKVHITSSPPTPTGGPPPTPFPPPDQACRTTADCPPGYICQNGGCVSGPGGDPNCMNIPNLNIQPLQITTPGCVIWTVTGACPNALISIQNPQEDYAQQTSGTADANGNASGKMCAGASSLTISEEFVAVDTTRNLISSPPVTVIYEATPPNTCAGYGCETSIPCPPGCKCQYNPKSRGHAGSCVAA